MNKFLKRVRNRIDSEIKKRLPFPNISSYKANGNLRLCHISAFNYGNAGDVILPVVLRDLFNQTIGVKSWKGKHVFEVMDKKAVNVINRTNGVVVGGGGLFLNDTNPNGLSGWQWSFSVDELKGIESPIVMFAVGYNRFRNQSDFDPIFKTHLNEFVRKAGFIGIRNTGSIGKLRQYLDSDLLKEKLVFQPCMTTLISKIYPNSFDFDSKADFIAVNCAFDREELRIKNDEILHSIAIVLKEMSKITKIKYYSHMASDNKVLAIFDRHQIPYELVTLDNPKQIIREYAKPRLVIGMRGHAQMIPFGCKTPILSIVSHDKMQWFLNDISNPDWGVDVNDDKFENKLLMKSIQYYNDYQSHVREITKQQEILWQITLNNMNNIKHILK